jgi:hypothetical protein
MIPPFNHSDTQVLFERSFDFPKNLVAAFREAGFGTPFKPDAWLIHGNHWLFVECKHAIKTSDIRLFDKKLKTLRPYMSDKWFRGDRDPPRTVIGVVISPSLSIPMQSPLTSSM